MITIHEGLDRAFHTYEAKHGKKPLFYLVSAEQFQRIRDHLAPAERFVSTVILKSIMWNGIPVICKEDGVVLE